MLVRFGFELGLEFTSQVTIITALGIHPSRDVSVCCPDTLHTQPPRPVEHFLDAFGNRCGRLVAPPGRLRLWADGVAADSGEADAVAWNARQHEVAELPIDALPYIQGSRYCDTDRLTPIAWQLFGNGPQGWGRVQAVCDWVHHNVQFGYAFASSTRSAFEVYQERVGVCRDFAHLAITFCRCLNIPARYASGYLGDIGVPEDPNEMDFSAWFEAFVGGRWYTFDARHNMPRVGRQLMVRGRDAADVAMLTSFGVHHLSSFRVWTYEVDSTHSLAPEVMLDSRRNEGVSNFGCGLAEGHTPSSGVQPHLPDLAVRMES
jgi:transglutaminase-like putative cysteine protease